MKPHERAEWQAIRAAKDADTLARKARMGAAIPQDQKDAGLRVYHALQAKGYTVRLGVNGSQHIVTVASVKSEDKPAIEYAANEAIGKIDVWPDVRCQDRTYITIEPKYGRAIYEQERWLVDGDGGTKLVPNQQGGFTQIGHQHHDKPLANDDSAYTDPYGITQTKKAS